MVRWLISTIVQLAANAVGLLVAASLLDGMSVSGAAFVLAVLIFTAVEALVSPMIQNVAANKARALLGATALVVTFVGLVATDLLSDGLSITGVSTWIGATVIVWLASLVAALLLPVLFVRRKADERRS